MSDKLLELQGVSQTFRMGRREIRAVDQVSFSIAHGEILCLVGESGCGKTTTGKMVAGLLRPTTGRVLFEGGDIWSMDSSAFQRYRRAVQIIHQDPYSSLNPVRTVYKTLSAPLFRHQLVSSRKDAEATVKELLDLVGLTPADDFIQKYPHQLSGGQRQRVSVARALTVKPQFIVADEAVSMVDVSLRIGLLNILSRLKEQLGVTFLFVTHDLSLAKYFAWEGRIAVMYLGKVVEIARTPQLLGHPEHPYTRALLGAVPEADPDVTRAKERFPLRSLDVPSLFNLPSGCAFHPRCPIFVQGLCDTLRPDLDPVPAPDQLLGSLRGDHLTACHLAGSPRAERPKGA